MNEDIISPILTEYSRWKGELPAKVERIAPAGSNRNYFRIYHQGGGTIIATHNPDNIRENETFIAFTKQFKKHGINVPEVLHVSEKKDIYFQTDNGTDSLLDILKQEGYSKTVFEYYKKALSALARIQVIGHKEIDFSFCPADNCFDKEAILYDLHYFLFYFLNPLGIAYHKPNLLQNFDTLAEFLSTEKSRHFMYRDFQSRNIMVKEGDLTFIDYQGGMEGPLQYDVVSLLWQTKADLPKTWKEELSKFYFYEVNQLLNNTLDADTFFRYYDGFVLIRKLQTLGAYGFRGLFERKPHFLSVIPSALHQLKDYLESFDVPVHLPELIRVLKILTGDAIQNRFRHKVATAESPLVVHIKSFSYKKGIPQDPSENGGGYIFDCRPLHNPGRYPAYVDLTGRDEPVQQFLLTRSLMPHFLEYVFSIADIAVQNYLERGFDSLMICFGCTGGKHRSVFAADKLAVYLKEKYHVHIALEHIERGWEKEYL